VIVLSGADLVLPDRVMPGGALVIEGDRISDIRPASSGSAARGSLADTRHYIVPGFIDVHLHGLHGVDVISSDDSVVRIAADLPRYGVTAFCPTTVACSPEALQRVLLQVRRARELPPRGAARVLPAHLESNFIAGNYRGAQPAACLRSPGHALRQEPESAGDFTGLDILREVEQASSEIGIVTLASELAGGLELVEWLTSRGHRAALGHSGATCEEALAAIDRGACHATHLFNCMPPFNHRAPGLVGAILRSDRIAAELICDGRHVHPAAIHAAVAAKGSSRIMAVSDATAACGLPRGSRAALGGQMITTGDGAAYLDDGRLAGGIATMADAFRMLVGPVGLSLVDAARLCSTTPARELGLAGLGGLSVGALADFVVLDARLGVLQTYVGGELVYARSDKP